MKTLIALTFLLSSYALMADSVVFNKAEVELKVALTKNGYSALKKALSENYKVEESERTDYYFDVFDNGHYVLRDLPLPIKLRFMWDGENLKWQNQKVIKTNSRSIFSIKTIEASEIEMKYDKALFESINSYFQGLSQKDAYALAIASDIQNTLVKSKVLEESAQHYFPTHTNHKKRVKIKLKIDNDQFSVQLGETNNRGVFSYEMEAEVKKSSDINKSADRLNSWLQSQGFNASHIDISVPVDPTSFSEKLLNELFVFSIQNF